MSHSNRIDFTYIFHKLYTSSLMTARIRGYIVDQVKTPEEACQCACKLFGKHLPDKLQRLIAEDGNYSYHYADTFWRGSSFPLGEPAIAKGVESAFAYAQNVLHGPFPLGEPAIATIGYFSYLYACQILHGPFPLGEPAIARSPYGVSYFNYYYRDSWATYQDWENSVLRRES